MSNFRFKRSYPETHRSQRSWDERFEALVKYKAQNGHCNVPIRYKLDTGLGQFVTRIKNEKIEVTDEQRARLSALGFDWETLAQKRERNWMEMFTQFRENHSAISSTKNTKLYDWVARQRSLNSKGQLRTDRYQKLQSVGFDWRMVQNHIKPLDVTNRNDKQWIAMYHKLVEFYQENNHVMVPFLYENDRPLGRWVWRQRRKYKGRELSDDRIRLLNDVQFVWKYNSNDASTSRCQRDWDDMFGLLKDYKGMYGNVKVPCKKVHRQRSLGQWLSNQRYNAGKGRLDPLRALHLMSIGVEWNFRDEPWRHYYNILEVFHQKHGHCMVATESGDNEEQYKGLVHWMKTQNDLHEKGELSIKRKALLDHLGFGWGREWPLRKSKTAEEAGREVVPSLELTRKTSLTSFSSPWAEEVVSSPPSYCSATDSSSPEEVLSLSPPYPLSRAEGQVDVSAHSQKSKGVVGALNAKVAKRATKQALKKAPGRSMKTKHLRRQLREVFGLPCTSSKRELEQLLDRTINSSFKIVKREKVVTLLKHHTGKVQSVSPLELPRKKSLNSFNSPWAEEVVSSSPSHHLAADLPRPKEVLSLPPSFPLSEAEQQADVSAHSQKAKEVVGALNAKVVKRAMRKALKKAPGRSMKTKHLRRQLREVFDLPRTSRKRDLERLLDGALNSSSKIAKQGKVLTLLKHHTTEVHKEEQQADASPYTQKDKEVLGALNAKVVKRALKTALKKAPGRSMKSKHLRRHLREVFDLPCTSKKRDLERLLDGAIDSSFKIVKREKVVILLKHHTAKV